MPQTWLIVGASRGIGLEFATQLLEQGHTVIATARKAPTDDDQSGLGALGQTLNGKKNLTLLECDVSDEASIKTFAAQVGELAAKGGVLGARVLDNVVLNAGILVYPNRMSEV
jgi:NAD(P)-dependent dehydrogenase (short-subunit alcohol dehydrogenase family)